MAVDPQGENSKDFRIDPLVAAGGNSSAARRLRVKSQLRDRFGRWIEMGRDSKIKARWQGKVVSIIGKFVGGSPDKPGYGMFVVKDDPNGIPSGVYHFKGRAVNQIIARLDPEYLKSNNIDIDRDVNGNLIGDVMDKDIEDVENVRRDEIGSLDEALAGGQVQPEEDAVKVVARLKSPKYESENVVATLEEASKDDIAEGSDVVREALDLESPEQEVNIGSSVDKMRGSFRELERLLLPSRGSDKVLGLARNIADIHDRSYGKADYPSEKVRNLLELLSQNLDYGLRKGVVTSNNDKEVGRISDTLKYFVDANPSKKSRAVQSPDITDEELPTQGPKRRNESWYVDADGKNYSEENVPKNLKTLENRRTWNPNTNEVFDGNGKVIPFVPTYDEKFNPVPKPEDAPEYSNTNPWEDLKEVDPYKTRGVPADETMSNSVDEAYDFLNQGMYVMCSPKVGLGVLLKDNKNSEEKKRAEKELGPQPKPSKEVLAKINAELETLPPPDRMRILSAINPSKFSAKEADDFLNTLQSRQYASTTGRINVKERRGLIKSFRNLPIDMTNLNVIGDKNFTQNGLGVKRGDMPAVKSADHGVFEARLKELGIGFTFEEMKSNDMIQVQREMAADNVGGMVESIINGSFKPWLTKKGQPNPIYVAKNGEILDGHHRYAAAVVAGWAEGETNSNPSIPVVRIDLPYEEALTLMNEWGNFHGIESQTLDKNRKGNLSEFFEIPMQEHVDDIFSQVEAGGFVDINGLRSGNTNNQKTLGLRDYILSTAEKIESSGGSPVATREQMFAKLATDAINYARDLQKVDSTNEGGSDLGNVAKKIFEASGVDLSQPSDDETNAQARDALLHMSELIEKSNAPDKAELYDRLADRLVEHFDNKKNGTHGAKKFAGRADTIQKITERKEGTTIDPFKLSQNRKGIAVALDGRNEETIDTLFFDDRLGDLLLSDYVEKNLDKFDGNFKLGTWHDRDNNEVTLDVIELFPETNRDEAVSAGQQRNQQGIFKLSNKEYIDTGGTGDRGRARREREQSRSESGLGLGDRQGRVESPQSDREDREGFPSQGADNEGTSELGGVKNLAPRQPADPQVLNSKLVDELIPSMESDTDITPKASEWLSNLRATLQNGGDVSADLESGIDELKSDNIDGKNNKAISSIQRLINSTKRFKNSHRPNFNRVDNVENSDESLPENIGTDENPNREPSDSSDYVVDGVSEPEENLQEQFQRIGIERASALELNTRTIDRSKLNERQKKILTKMITQRNKAIKAVESFVETKDPTAYDNAYNYALATTNAIKRLIGGVETYGDSYKFGSGEEDRIKNFLIIEDSIKYASNVGPFGKPKVVGMKGFYTSKTGATYSVEWSGSQTQIKTITADGLPGRLVSYVTVNVGGEDSRGPEFPASATPSYLKTSEGYKGQGLGAASITFARLALEKSGRHFAHSSALTPDGANNSKGIDSNDPDRHHQGQAEKVLHMMGAPAIELMQRLGWFDSSYRMRGNMGMKGFETFLRPIAASKDWNRSGSSDMVGPLYTQDMATVRSVGDVWMRRRRGETVVAGVDYPAFMDEHVRSTEGNYGSFSLRTLLTDMSYKDGISKEDGIKRLKQMKTDLAEYRGNVYPDPTVNADSVTEYKLLNIDGLDKTLGELINGLEQWDDFDSKRVDRPKPFPADSFKTMSVKPYGELLKNEGDEKFDFQIGYGPMAYKTPYSKNRTDYTTVFGEAPPENWTGSPNVLAKRYTSDELKAAIKQGVVQNLTGKFDNSTNGFIVNLDHRREYAETPQMAPVHINTALSALHLQGVDSDAFLISVVDEKNGDTAVADAFKAQRMPRTSLLKEMDSVLKALKIKKTKISEQVELASQVERGSYDAKNKVVGTRLKEEVEQPWVESRMENILGYSPTSPLIDNEKFDYPDGRTDILGSPADKEVWMRADYARKTAGTMPTYASSNPLYIQHAFNKEDLVEAFKDALTEQRQSVNLKFATGQVAEINLEYIRDALQYQGVDTNGLARSIFANFVGREEMDVKLKPEGRIVPRTAEEVVEQSNNVIDLKDFIPVKRFTNGVNSPELWESPDGKKYVVKALRTGADGLTSRAIDQEIATQAFYRALGINASVSQRGIYNGKELVVSEYIEAGNVSYTDAIVQLMVTQSGFADANDQSPVKAVANGLIGDLFLDQVDGPFNSGNVIIDPDGNVVRIDGGGGLLWDGMPEEGTKDQTARYAAGGFENATTEEQRNVWRIAREGGSFEGDGIEFGLDYFLNPNGWHWNITNAARKKILENLTPEDLKAQAERYLLNNMTPDKIDKVSRVIRNPKDRARVAEALLKRRERILNHFGIEDTYNPEESELINRVPYLHQLEEFDDLNSELESSSILTFDEYMEYNDKLSAPDMTVGKLSGLIAELRAIRDNSSSDAVDPEQLIENKKKKLDDAVKETVADTSDFGTNGNSTDNEDGNPYVPLKVDVNNLNYGDYISDVDVRLSGYVLFKSVRPDGKLYVGLVSNGGYFVERVFTPGESVTLDIGSRTRGGIKSVQESEVPPNDPRSTPGGIGYINRLRSRSNAVIEDIMGEFPSSRRLPNGDLIIGSRNFTERSRLRRTFRFDIMVHRMPNEKFVSYVRRTQVDPNGYPIGEPVIGRISKETHSSRHLGNRIRPLITNGGNRGVYANNPNNWFNNSPDLQPEVIHPGTNQPIPASLAPQNLNQKYIGNTGIEETGDPIKDALIGYVADLIDRGHEVSTVMNRTFQQTVLSRSQVADIAERIQANRQFPGVNQIPYVSRDNRNIVREGDRVRHYHPDGTIRMGYVVKRQPLVVHRRYLGNYGYTDVLRVNFDDGTRSPIVAKNLEIIRRADGSVPEISPPAAEQIIRDRGPVFVEPTGLPSNFSIRDTASSRLIRNADNPIEHSQGKVMTIVGADKNVYVGAVWDRGQDPSRDMFTKQIRVYDPNVAQAWVIAQIRKREELYEAPKSGDSSGPIDVELGLINNAPVRTSSPAYSPVATDEDLPDSTTTTSARRRKSETPIASNNPEEGIEEEPEVPFGVDFTVETKGDEIIIKTVGYRGKDDKGSKLQPVTVIRTEEILDENDEVVLVNGKPKTGRFIVTFLNEQSYLEDKGGLATAVRAREKVQDQIYHAKEKMVDAITYELTGPHSIKIFEDGEEMVVEYPDFAALRLTPEGRKHFIKPKKVGDPILKPESVFAFRRHLTTLLTDENGEDIKPRKNRWGKPLIVFLGGGPGAGKSSISRPRPNVKRRGDDPKGFERIPVPNTKQILEDGTVAPNQKDITAVIVNPDDIKVMLQDGMSRQLKLSLADELDGIDITSEDRQWANGVHELSSILAKSLTQEAIRRQLDIVVDGTGDDTLDKMIKKANAAKARGYHTKADYLNADPMETMGGVIGRQLDTKRNVQPGHSIKTYMNLAVMFFSKHNKIKSDGSVRGPEEPSSLLEGVFDEFALYQRGDIDTEPLLIGYSNESTGKKWVLNTTTEKTAEEAQKALGGLEILIPTERNTKKAIFERIRKRGAAEGKQKKKAFEKKIKENQKRDKEERLREAEQKGNWLEYNKIANSMKLSQVAAATGLPVQFLVDKPRLVFMLKNGASVKEMIDFVQEGVF